ncbi:PEGA domain-containing protein, partial [bacterium]|nr:PEGA domain-containing protein [bacterium]
MFFLILVLILVKSVFSQEFEKFSVERSRFLEKTKIFGSWESGRNKGKDKLDANGKFLSGIKIITPVEGLVVESRLSVYETERKPGEVFVYVSPYETALTLYATGHEPLEIILSGQGIRLKESEVWEIRLKTTAKHSSKTEKGTLILDTVPGGCTITIDGLPAFSEKTPYTFKDWISQRYEIGLELTGNEDYEKLDTLIFIEAKQTSKATLKLKPTFGTLQVETDSEAEIFLDGEFVGKGNFSGKAKVGEHTLTIKRNWFATLDTVLVVESGKFFSKNFKLKPTFGTLQVETDSEAEIFLDGEFVGKGNFSGKAKVGEHTLRISKGEKFYSILENFYLEALENKIFKKSLKAKTGELVVSVLPKEAVLFLEGKAKGNSVSEVLQVGTYKVRAELLPDYVTQEKSVTIGEGKVSELNFELELQSKGLLSGFEKWKFRRNVFLYTGLSFLAAGSYSNFLQQKAGKDYEAASSEVEVKSAKDRSSKWKAVSIVSYGIGGASLFGA